MRILYLSPRVCWPTRSGAHLRDFHLSRQLAKYADLVFVGLETEPLSNGQVEQRERLPELHDATLVRAFRGAGYSRLNLIRGFLGPRAVGVLNFTKSSVARVVEQLVREQPFDAVQVENVHLVSYAEMIRRIAPGLPILCDWHNIESEIQDRYALENTGSLRAVYARRTAHLLRKSEREFLRAGDAHTVCSERERQALLAIDPSLRVEVIENGVDVSYFSAARDLQGGPRRSLLFVGLMEYHANVEAVKYFAREVWPGIRQTRPELRFVIAGARPTPEVTAMAAEPGIVVTGTVEDLRPNYRDAVAAVVPLRVGGGTRLKILEAMAAGVPVVSTSLGAEGLRVTPGRDLMLADTPAAMMEVLVNLEESSTQWRELVENANRLVRAEYDWDAIGRKLRRVYAEHLGVGIAEDRQSSG